MSINTWSYGKLSAQLINLFANKQQNLKIIVELLEQIEEIEFNDSEVRDFLNLLLKSEGLLCDAVSFWRDTQSSFLDNTFSIAYIERMQSIGQEAEYFYREFGKPGKTPKGKISQLEETIIFNKLYQLIRNDLHDLKVLTEVATVIKKNFGYSDVSIPDLVGAISYQRDGLVFFLDKTVQFKGRKVALSPQRIKILEFFARALPGQYLPVSRICEVINSDDQSSTSNSQVSNYISNLRSALKKEGLESYLVITSNESKETIDLAYRLTINPVT